MQTLLDIATTHMIAGYLTAYCGKGNALLGCQYVFCEQHITEQTPKKVMQRQVKIQHPHALVDKQTDEYSEKMLATNLSMV